MATVHLMVGLPGSGKTAEAIRLEEQYHALRFTPDEWQSFLFGHDIAHPEHDARHTRIEELIWKVASQALKLDVDVILDFGVWTRDERETFREKAHSLGATMMIHYMDVPKAEIWRRLEVRNQLAGEHAVFYVAKEAFDEWADLFEPPTEDEMEAR